MSSDAQQTSPETFCPKCNTPMERGFTVDMLAGELALRRSGVSKWAPGPAIKSVLFKTWVPRGTLPIGTFRCRSCGYLESYARPEYAARFQRQFSLRTLLVFVTVVAIVLGVIVWAIRS